MCVDCRFRGNVITKSNNKVITVHGTHRALVDNNVIYDHRGAFLYIEDGNEYENVISNNLLLCPEYNDLLGYKNNRYPDGGDGEFGRCLLQGVHIQLNDDYDRQTGLYVNGPSNHFIGNHGM